MEPDKDEITYSKVRGKDDEYSLFLNGEAVGTVIRFTHTVPAKRKDQTRRITEFRFAPTGEYFTACSTGTMKTMKQVLTESLQRVKTQDAA